MQDNGKKPALRFKGFTDPWEQRKVGDHLIPSKLPGHTGVDARKLTVKLWGKGVVEKTDSYGGSEHTQYYVRHAGQFMYGKLDFLHAAFGIVPAELDNYESTLDSPAFDLSEINGKFLVSRVCKEDFYLKYGTIANGSRKAKRIHEDTFMDMPILVPELEEQERVAALLEALDTLITLHQRKYEKLVNIKKSMLDKMFPKNGASVPEIRFKGFTDPWEQRKLDEAFDFTVPNNTLSRAELNQESGSVRNVHYGDVLIKYGSVLDAQNDELPFITGRSKDDFKGALLQNGDIIIADTAEDETTGKVCEIVNIQDKDVVAGLHTMVCRPKNKTAEGYFGYYMNSSSYHHQLLPLMQGIKVLSLSKTNVQKTTVKYPKDKAEQQKIADCLRRIDTLITLHQRKLEKLQNIKKSCLEKMFV